MEYVGEGWGDILAAADVVISRAGANALFELLALHKLNLLVPLPAASSRGDQLENAAFAEEQGYSLVLREEALTTESLLAALSRLHRERTAFARRLAAVEPLPATERIVEVILTQAGG